ncbi:Glycosyltransferase [Desulfovibrio sp. DV]|nr:Glycosyltransferase [Desulfovibrio sp. DV]
MRKHHEAIVNSKSAMAYAILKKFGHREELVGSEIFSAELLAWGNYIDAMVMFDKNILVKLGGYEKMEIGGWEDYNLICNLIENKYEGCYIGEILCLYRVHGESMLHVVTNKKEEQLREIFRNRFSFIAF